MLLQNPQLLDYFPKRLRELPAERFDVKSFLQRLQLLTSHERLLIEMALKHGLSRRQMGLALNLPPGTVTRRLRRLLNRIYDPLIDDLLDRTCTLSPEHRKVGIEYFLQRRTIEQIARERGSSLWQVRQMVEYVRGWQRGIKQHHHNGTKASDEDHDNDNDDNDDNDEDET